MAYRDEILFYSKLQQDLEFYRFYINRFDRFIVFWKSIITLLYCLLHLLHLLLLHISRTLAQALIVKVNLSKFRCTNGKYVHNSILLCSFVLYIVFYTLLCVAHACICTKYIHRAKLHRNVPKNDRHRLVWVMFSRFSLQCCMTQGRQ